MSNILVALYQKKNYVFFTGDLGFMALENIRDCMGDNFINAGIAEQNMVTIAAGVASTGLQAWVYSIASFVYARPFEQIRNDVCLHNANVKLIGNGGGYSYGALGATHHALEDYGTLLTLQNMQVFIPAFSDDLFPIIDKMANNVHPAYLRLGKCEKPKTFLLPPYRAWRKILSGKKSVMLIIGALAGGILSKLMDIDVEYRPEVWILSELPLDYTTIPREFLYSLKKLGHLQVVEEHVLQGSVGQILSHLFLSNCFTVKKFNHYCAKGYPSGYYGSQDFHRRECGLDVQTLLNTVVLDKLVAHA